MARILENNGIDNTNIDGASFNNFCAGQRSGIIKGILNECAITSPSTSVININTGALIISGVRVFLDTATNFNFSTFPSTATRYSLVAEIVVDDNSAITTRLFVQLASVALTKNSLFATSTGAGTYQIELAKFTLSTSGVSDLIRTVDVITGGTGSGESTHWEVGDIITETLDVDIPAEVDIDYNEDTKKYDFSFGIPQGPTGPQGEVGPQGETGPSIVSAAFDGDDIKFTKDDETEVVLEDAKLTLKGDTGLTGLQGETGAGVVAGGTTGQVLKKRTATDYDTEWADTLAISKQNGSWTGTVENKGDDISFKTNFTQIGGYVREHSISINGDITHTGEAYDYIKLAVGGNTSGSEKSKELKITENAVTIDNNNVLTNKFTLGSDATGDIYYRNSDGEFTRLAIGNENEQLLVSEGLPEWKVDYSKIIHLTSTEMEAQLSSLPIGTVCLCSDPLTTGTYVSKTIYIIIQVMAEKLWNRIGKLAILIKDENVILEPSDFVEDTTYSNFGYRANYDNIMYSMRTPDVYFSAETINNTITEENIFMIENWSESLFVGGLYIYAKNLPLTNVVIDKLEVFE